MPELTSRPNVASRANCRIWAAGQSAEAIKMWGIRGDGTSSRSVAIDRLVGSCMGQNPPEIVGFGSSVGFDREYCEKHPAFKICRERKPSE
jgi:hypothetical protein